MWLYGSIGALLEHTGVRWIYFIRESGSLVFKPGQYGVMMQEMLLEEGFVS